MAKFYAVKEGREPGIYTSWPEAQAQVSGFAGAVFKSFPSKADAESYLGISQNPFVRHGASQTPTLAPTIPEIIANFDEDNATDTAIIYTDGSYNKDEKIYGYGYTITVNQVKARAWGGGENPDLVSMWQVGGELLAAIFSLQEALLASVSKIVIRYDYKGVEEWVQGTWDRNKPGTQWYRETMLQLISQFNGEVIFQKVKAHSNDPGNEEADQLAKKGAGLL